MRPITTRDEGDVVVVSLDDPEMLNDGRSTEYRVALYQLVEAMPDPKVAVDLGMVDYLSSSGVAALVGLKKRIDARRGGLILFGIHPHVSEILRITRLDRIFRIATDDSSAWEELAGPSSS